MQGFPLTPGASVEALSGEDQKESAAYIQNGKTIEILAEFSKKNAYLFPMSPLTTFKASKSLLIAHNNSQIQQSY